MTNYELYYNRPVKDKLMKIKFNKSTRNDKPDHYLMLMIGKIFISIYFFDWLQWGIAQKAIDIGPLSYRRID